MWRLPTDTMDAKAYRVFSRAQSVCIIERPMADVNIWPYGIHHFRNNLPLIPLGKCGRPAFQIAAPANQASSQDRQLPTPKFGPRGTVHVAFRISWSLLFMHKIMQAASGSNLKSWERNCSQQWKGEAHRGLNWPVVMFNTAVITEGLL
jgi:hypothetical protein